MAGITMLLEGHPATAVFTDPTGVEVDQPQYESEGAGPGIDAFRQQTTFWIADTATETRWPDFVTTAAAHRIHSILSLPLFGNRELVGGGERGAILLFGR